MKTDKDSWIASNWDKVIPLFLTLVAGSIGGFFAAMWEIKGELETIRLNAKDLAHTVDTQISSLETRLSEMANRNYERIEKNNEPIEGFRGMRIQIISNNPDLLRAILDGE